MVLCFAKSRLNSNESQIFFIKYPTAIYSIHLGKLSVSAYWNSGSSPCHSRLLAHLPEDLPSRQQMMARPLDPSTHIGHLAAVPVSQLWPGPAQMLCPWGVNQPMEHILDAGPLFLLF